MRRDDFDPGALEGQCGRITIGGGTLVAAADRRAVRVAGPARVLAVVNEERVHEQIRVAYLHSLERVVARRESSEIESEDAGHAADVSHVHPFHEHIIDVEIDDAVVGADELDAGAVEVDPERTAVRLRPMGVVVVFVAVALLPRPVPVILDVTHGVRRGVRVVEERQSPVGDVRIGAVDDLGGAEGVDREERAAGFHHLERVIAAGEAGAVIDRLAEPVGGIGGVGALLENTVNVDVHRAAVRSAGDDQFDVGAVEGILHEIAVGGGGMDIAAEFGRAPVSIVDPRTGVGGIRRGVVGKVGITGGNDVHHDDRVVRVPGVRAGQSQADGASVLRERDGLAVDEKTCVGKRLAVRRGWQDERVAGWRPEHVDVFLRVVHRAGGTAP